MLSSVKLFHFCKSDASAVQGYIQGHWIWHQSKARMWLFISPS